MPHTKTIHNAPCIFYNYDQRKKKGGNKLMLPPARHRHIESTTDPYASYKLCSPHMVIKYPLAFQR